MGLGTVEVGDGFGYCGVRRCCTVVLCLPALGCREEGAAEGQGCACVCRSTGGSRANCGFGYFGGRVWVGYCGGRGWALGGRPRARSHLACVRVVDRLLRRRLREGSGKGVRRGSGKGRRQPLSSGARHVLSEPEPLLQDGVAEVCAAHVLVHLRGRFREGSEKVMIIPAFIESAHLG